MARYVSVDPEKSLPKTQQPVSPEQQNEWFKIWRNFWKGYRELLTCVEQGAISPHEAQDILEKQFVPVQYHPAAPDGCSRIPWTGYTETLKQGLLASIDDAVESFYRQPVDTKATTRRFVQQREEEARRVYAAADHGDAIDAGFWNGWIAAGAATIAVTTAAMLMPMVRHLGLEDVLKVDNVLKFMAGSGIVGAIMNHLYYVRDHYLFPK